MQISLEKYEKLHDMLTTFSGGSLSKFSQEMTNRVIFATNFMKALSEIEITDETAESIETLLDLIISYEISIFDLYDYCGTQEVDIDKLVLFFANYTDYFNKRKSSLLETIYLAITSDTVDDDTNSALLDIVHKMDKLYVVDNSVRIIPKIKFSYVIPADNSYFINDLSAANSFYTNNAINTSIHESITLENDELHAVYELLKSSYDNKECFIYKFSQRSDFYDLLTFIKNFRTKGTTCNEIFYDNVFISDVPGLLKQLSEDIYYLYMADIVQFQNRNKVFKPGEYFKLLTIEPFENLTKDNYKYEFFKAMIKSGNQNIITDYADEIKTMKTYLNGIYSTALLDKRYTIGE